MKSKLLHAPAGSCTVNFCTSGCGKGPFLAIGLFFDAVLSALERTSDKIGAGFKELSG